VAEDIAYFQSIVANSALLLVDQEALGPRMKIVRDFYERAVQLVPNALLMPNASVKRSEL
jgi:hypothetical protein